MLAVSRERADRDEPGLEDGVPAHHGLQDVHELENDDDIRCGVLYGVGDHFTGGLDLLEVGPTVGSGGLDFNKPGRRDPWRKDDVWTKPLVAAVQGWVMTLAIELLLAADIGIAASDSRFQQLEIRRGIYAFGSNRVQHEVAPKVVLASAVIDIPRAFVTVAREVKEGHFHARPIEETMQDGTIAVVYNPALESAVRAYVRRDVDALADAVRSRTVAVPYAAL